MDHNLEAAHPETAYQLPGAQGTQGFVDTAPLMIGWPLLERPATPSSPRFYDSGFEGGSEDDSSVVTSSSSSDSLTPEVLGFTTRLGRKYHSYPDAALLEPIDDPQQDEWFMYDSIRPRQEKLFLSPIRPLRILDVGTGSGLWAVGLAECFPSASVVGIDLAPIQPEYVPRNCEFRLDNIETLPWYETDNSIDLVHMRQLHWMKSWSDLVAQSYRCLAPGGWFEWAEIEFLPDKHHQSWHQWKGLQEDIRRTSGRTRVPGNIEGIMAGAGFVNIRTSRLPILEGEDSDYRKVLDLEGMIAVLHTVCGQGESFISSLSAGMKRELLDRLSPVRINAIRVFGQKQ